MRYIVLRASGRRNILGKIESLSPVRRPAYAMAIGHSIYIKEIVIIS